MANTITIKQSSTASEVPTAGQLVQGELAINTTDKKLYSKDASAVFEIGVAGSVADGTVTDAAVRWSGSAWVEETQVQVAADGTLTILDSGLTDSLALSHDGTDFNIVGTNINNLNFTGIDQVRFDDFVDVIGEGLRIYNFLDNENVRLQHDNINFTIDGANAGAGADFAVSGFLGDIRFYGAGNQVFVLRNGMDFQINEADNTSRLSITHDANSTEFTLTGTGLAHTANWSAYNQMDISGGMDLRIRDGDLFISDAGVTSYGLFSHDGTDFNLAFTSTTDWNITGLTSIQAGTIDADFDSVTATDFNAVPLTAAGAATNYLDESGGYSVPVGGSEVNDLTSIVTWANVPNANITAGSVTQHATALEGVMSHDDLLDFISQEHIRWDLTGAGTIHTDNYIENATHTGQVTGSGVLTMVVAAITGQTDIGANLIATDEIVVSDGGVIRRADISRFNNYFNANLSFNNYTHPSHPGDDFSVDSGALSGATIISDIDINVTTDAEGHVTDANGVIATRELTAGDIGAEPADANLTKDNETETISGAWDFTTAPLLAHGTEIQDVSGQAQLFFENAASGLEWQVGVTGAGTDDFIIFNAPAGLVRFQIDDATGDVIISQDLAVTGALTAATYDGVNLTTAGAATNYLDESGSYSVPAGAGGGIGGSITNDQIAVGAASADDIEGSSSLTWNAVDLTTLGLRLTRTTDASLSSTAHAFQIGSTGSTNLIMDGNEIIARSNGAASTLNINITGGAISFGPTATRISMTTGGDLTLVDNGEIQFGGSADGKLYYASATDDVRLDCVSGTDFVVRLNSTEFALNCVANGAVTLYHNGGSEFFTQQHEATGNTSGAAIDDHGGTARDVGFNVLPKFNDNASDTLEARHCGSVQLKDATTNRTLTLAASGDLDFPVGGLTTILNAFTSGNYIVNEGSGTTLYVLDGSTRIDAGALGFIVPGGVANVWRESATVYYMWGSGVFP